TRALLDYGSLQQTGEYVSLALILSSFAIVAFLAARVKTVRSLQFEVFAFMSILFVSELPRIAQSLGFIQLQSLETTGLTIHTISMAFLSGFVMYRTFGF